MNPLHTRRHFLTSSAFNLGAFGLAYLLKQDGLLAAKPPMGEQRHYDLLPKKPLFDPKAKAMISMFMQGGPSQMDLFDPKPELTRMDGKEIPVEVKHDDVLNATKTAFGSPWKFAKHGQCGLEVSELLPGFAEIVDDVTLLRGMQSGVNNHGQAIFALQNGRSLGGRPCLGSWLTYGLGSESQELPAFVALPDAKGLPVNGVENWGNAWLPSIFQGTVVRSKEPRMLNLDVAPYLKGEAQATYLDYLGQLNHEHLAAHPGETDLEARIASYELAAKLQTAAREALDLSQESAETKAMYGIDKPESADFGTRCLIARRLVERGVRFVQLFTRGQMWDNHGSIRTNLTEACKFVDRPAAGLVQDLKQRGLLDTTVVHWGGEMGRLPVMEYADPAKAGRDHNTHGFSMWLAGGGFKRGFVFGETDEFGNKAVKDIVTHHDYHATLLHLFGLDHEKLTFTRNNMEVSLTDGQGGRVVKEILA